MCVHGLRESVVMVLNVCLHSCRNMACVHVVCNQTVVQYSVGLQRNTSCNPAQTMMCVASVRNCSNLFKKQNKNTNKKRQNHLAIAIRMQTVRLAPRFAHARSYPDGPLLLVWCAYGTYLLKLKSPHRMPARRPLALAASKPNDRVELNANASHSCTSEKKNFIALLR